MGRFARSVLACALLVASSACDPVGAGPAPSGSAQPDVRVSAQPVALDIVLPDFEMVDQKGRSVRKQDLAGKVWVVDFIFTTCPTVCPKLTQKMATLADRTKGDASLRFVSVTVDPENDTPAVLDAFAARYGADPERWSFLTGEPKHVEETVLKGFKMALQKDGANVVFHAERFLVVDKKGHVRGIFETEPADLDALLERARQLSGE